MFLKDSLYEQPCHVIQIWIQLYYSSVSQCYLVADIKGGTQAEGVWE